MKNKLFSLGFAIFILVVGFWLIGCDLIHGDTDKDITNENGAGSSDENDNGRINDVGIIFSASNNNVIGQAASNGGSSIYSNIYDMAYGNNIFVAVGISGQIAYSADGSNWTKSQNNGFRLNDSNVQGITYGNGRFVAFGSRSNVVSNGKLSTWWDIVYSSNGSNWARADTSNFNGAISKIIYGGDKFLAVSVSGKIAYSSNGSLWTPITDTALNDVTFNSVAYGANI
jgi:hypothetical protein